MNRLSAAACASAILASALSPAGLAGCGSDEVIQFPSTTAGGGGANSVVEAQIDPAPGGLRRLIRRQYIGSVRVMFGESAALAADPPVDVPLHGFQTIGASELAVSDAKVEALEASASAIGQAVVADTDAFEALLPCTPSGPDDDACMESFISKVGRVAWRRDLTSAEVAAIGAVAGDAAAEYDSFDQGAVYAISALLQSPYFLYIVELGEEDPDDQIDGQPTRYRLTSAELATRLAFFLTDATPSEALLDAAADGDLDTESGVRKVARELLEQPVAKDALKGFFGEQWKLDFIDGTAKNQDDFPEFTPELQASMREEVERLIDYVVWTQDGDARDLFSANYAFVDEHLAPIYGVTAPSSGFAKTTLPSSQQRSGFLTSAAFLAVYSHAAKTSPTKRGLFIRRNVMCGVVPPPPNDVVPELPEDDPDTPKTMKQKLDSHNEEPLCASCHQLTDPLGYSLEVFDPIGRHRTKDQGLTIDTSGESTGVGSFDDMSELSGLLRELPEVPACMVLNLYRHSMGHLEQEGEAPALEALEKAFVGADYSVQDILVEIVASPAFQLVGDPK